MGGGKLLLAGLGWPFVVAAIAVLIPCCTDRTLSDRQAEFLFALGLAACPAVVVGLFRCLPPEWSDTRRVATAILVGVPLAGVVIYLALLTFALVAFHLGQLV